MFQKKIVKKKENSTGKVSKKKKKKSRKIPQSPIVNKFISCKFWSENVLYGVQSASLSLTALYVSFCRFYENKSHQCNKYLSHGRKPKLNLILISPLKHISSNLVSFKTYSSATWGLPGGLVRLRICLQCRRLGFDPWVRKIPWRRKWQPTSVLLPGESH